jgi:superfamily II DNA or RNA helicase
LKVILLPFDNVFIRIQTNPDLDRELYEYFSFQPEGFRFMPAYRKKYWDGRLRLYRRGKIYYGLQDKIKDFCLERGYEFENRVPVPTPIEPILPKFLEPFVPRDYQIEIFRKALEKRRGLFLSPTSSGKTASVFMIAEQLKESRVLILVPTTTLVHQGLQHFKQYGYTGTIHGIVAGEDRHTDAQVCFACWQSVIREKSDWLKQFSTIICDEAHTATAKSLTLIMENSPAENRFGFTATLSGSETHEMILTGLFGPAERIITTKELMDREIIAKANVQMVTLRHPEKIRKTMRKAKYQDEIQFLIDCEARNEFITNLAVSLKGNTLVLYTRIDEHGQKIFDKIVAKRGAEDVYFLHGGIDGKIRNEVRAKIEGAENAIIVGSYGVTSTGIDITRLHNLI